MTNSREIKNLHPTLQRGAIELVRRCKAAGLDILITQTYRDNEYQNSLYAQGRTKDGNIVTKAKGGQSMHNYKLAFDFCKNVKGHEYDDNSFFRKVGQIWTDMGGVWGGNWEKFRDLPHCEFTNGLTVAKLQGGAKMPDVKMKWEENKPVETISASEPTNVDYVIKDLNLRLYGKYIKVQGIVKDGVSYMPTRGVFEGIGDAVDYDNNTDTINIDMNMEIIKINDCGDIFTLEGKNINGTNYMNFREDRERQGKKVSFENGVIVSSQK